MADKIVVNGMKLANMARAMLAEIERGDGYVAAGSLVRAMRSIATSTEENMYEAVYGGVERGASTLAQKACLALFQGTDTITNHAMMRHLASPEFSTQQEDNYLQLDDDKEAARYRKLIGRVVRNLEGLLAEIDKIETGKR